MSDESGLPQVVGAEQAVPGEVDPLQGLLDQMQARSQEQLTSDEGILSRPIGETMTVCLQESTEQEKPIDDSEFKKGVSGYGVYAEAQTVIRDGHLDSRGNSVPENTIQEKLAQVQEFHRYIKFRFGTLNDALDNLKPLSPEDLAKLTPESKTQAIEGRESSLRNLIEGLKEASGILIEATDGQDWQIAAEVLQVAPLLKGSRYAEAVVDKLSTVGSDQLSGADGLIDTLLYTHETAEFNVKEPQKVTLSMLRGINLGHKFWQGLEGRFQGYGYSDSSFSLGERLNLQDFFDADSGRGKLLVDAFDQAQKDGIGAPTQLRPPRFLLHFLEGLTSQKDSIQISDERRAQLIGVAAQVAKDLYQFTQPEGPYIDMVRTNRVPVVVGLLNQASPDKTFGQIFTENQNPSGSQSPVEKIIAEVIEMAAKNNDGPLIQQLMSRDASLKKVS